MANNLPPMPRDPIGENHKWREWFNVVRNSIVGVGGSVPTLHNSLSGIQGGTSTERYHLTQSDYVGIGDFLSNGLSTTDLNDVSDTAPSITGQVLVWDNTAGYYTPTTVAYGEMYATNASQTTTVSASNTAYEVTGGFTGGTVLRTTFGGDHYLQVTDAGNYKVNWSLSIDTSAGGDEIEGGVMINGVAQGNATAHTTVATSSAGSTVASSGIIALAANDQVSLFVRNHTGTRDITMEHASCVIEKLLA